MSFLSFSAQLPAKLQQEPVSLIGFPCFSLHLSLHTQPCSWAQSWTWAQRLKVPLCTWWVWYRENQIPAREMRPIQASLLREFFSALKILMKMSSFSLPSASRDNLAPWWRAHGVWSCFPLKEERTYQEDVRTRWCLQLGSWLYLTPLPHSQTHR